MKILSIILLFITVTAGLIFSSHAAQTDLIRPFTTDGCSAFPDGTITQKNLWLSCCTAHDRAYWKGGTYQQRLEADKELQQCVANVGEPDIGKLMLAGVRVGGSPYLPTNFRWGYGWKYPKPYGEFSNNETTNIISSELNLSDQENFQFKLSSGEVIFVKYIAIKNIEQKDKHLEKLNFFVDEFKEPLINNPIIESEDNKHLKKGLDFVYYVALEELFSDQKSHIKNAELIWNQLKPIVEKHQIKLTQIQTVAFTERDSAKNKERFYATLSSEYLQKNNAQWKKKIRRY
jgi:hypothetical protein